MPMMRRLLLTVELKQKYSFSCTLWLWAIRSRTWSWQSDRRERIKILAAQEVCTLNSAVVFWNFERKAILLENRFLLKVVQRYLWEEDAPNHLKYCANKLDERANNVPPVTCAIYENPYAAKLTCQIFILLNIFCRKSTRLSLKPALRWQPHKYHHNHCDASVKIVRQEIEMPDRGDQESVSGTVAVSTSKRANFRVCLELDQSIEKCRFAVSLNKLIVISTTSCKSCFAQSSKISAGWCRVTWYATAQLSNGNWQTWQSNWWHTMSKACGDKIGTWWAPCQTFL